MNVDLNVFNTCVTSRVSVELERACFVAAAVSVNDSFPIGSVMMDDPLIHQHR